MLLLLEDDPHLRQLLKNKLTKQGFDVFAYGQVSDINIHLDTLKLLICDIALPKQKGTDFVKTIAPEIPVIFMSARDESALEGLSLTNPKRFLRKPFLVEELIATVRDLLG
jgi:DNA-binding response OmpR family regulator